MSPDRIHQVLARERRAAVAEFTLTGFFFVLFAGFFLLASLFLLTLFAAFMVGSRPFLANFETAKSLPGTLALACLGIITVLNWRQLYEGQFNPRRIFMFRPIFDETAQLAVEILNSLILAGPRCAVMAFTVFQYAWKLVRLDLDRLQIPIQIALLHHRKIRQRDLTDVDLDQFLKDTQWLKGVIPLYAPPAGFVLTAEFRHELGDASAFVTDDQPRARIAFPEEPPPMTEREWALSILELEGHPTAREIKIAYRRLAKMYHPDVRKSPEAESKMKALNRAKEILDS